MSASLSAELRDFGNFLTDQHFPGRRVQPVGKKTAKNHLQSTKLLLGWFCHHQEIQQEQLSLDFLVPKLSQESVDNCLHPTFDISLHQDWINTIDYVKDWLPKYWDFLDQVMNSKSPRTRRFRTQALRWIGLYQYRNLVFSRKDYTRIPILQLIDELDRHVRSQCREWERLGKRVVDHEQVWPDLVEGQTALLTIRQQVTESLRQVSNINYAGKRQRRSSSAITKSHQRYLSWAFLSDMPAQRQQEYREIKIALHCPMERPSSVPIQGLYHPKAEVLDETVSKEEIQKVFLYKVYLINERKSTKGEWVIEFVTYKTDQSYGKRVFRIANRTFSDGQTFYDYLERYLYGCWQPSSEGDCLIVNWWDIYQSGIEGKWLMKGRSEFPICSDHQTDIHSHLIADWGYFFVKPEAGNCYTDSEYAGFVSTASHTQIKKRISPHRMRHIWATWAFQVGLTDNQIESLAYKMGVSVDVLRDWYEQCSPDEKRRPIEEVIDVLIFDEPNESEPIDLAQIIQNILDLPPSERQQIIDQYL